MNEVRLMAMLCYAHEKNHRAEAAGQAYMTSVLNFTSQMCFASGLLENSTDKEGKPNITLTKKGREFLHAHKLIMDVIHPKAPEAKGKKEKK